MYCKKNVYNNNYVKYGRYRGSYTIGIVAYRYFALTGKILSCQCESKRITLLYAFKIKCHRGTTYFFDLRRLNVSGVILR